MKEIKTLGKLTTELQTVCHEGFAECEVLIAIDDAFFRAGNINKVTVGNNETDSKTYFAIQAERLSDR